MTVHIFNVNYTTICSKMHGYVIEQAVSINKVHKNHHSTLQIEHYMI